MDDWDERWLDIRRIDLLTDIMTARIRLAVENGCDDIEPDNMDAYSNSRSETQLNLSYQDQLNYNRWIANKAHELGISVALKNDVEQIGDLVNDFDFAVNEECFYYDECSAYDHFTTRNKAVFGVEYEGNPAEFCPLAKARKLSWQKKRRDLGTWRIGCENV